MSMRRDDTDRSRRYFRSSERVFRVNEAWYFAAREGDQGAFQTESGAHAELDRFVLEKQELAHFQAAREAERGNRIELKVLDAERERLLARTVPELQLVVN